MTNYDGMRELSYRYKNGGLSEIISNNYEGDEDYLSCIIKYDINKISEIDATHKTVGYENLYRSCHNVLWQGDNIKQATITYIDEEGDTYSTDYIFEYDDKINPFYGLFASINHITDDPWMFEFSLFNISKNNCISIIKNNSVVITYTYSYDEDGYPISVDKNICGAPTTGIVAIKKVDTMR